MLLARCSRLTESCEHAPYGAEAYVGDDVCETTANEASGFQEMRCQAPCQADPECGCGVLCLDGSCAPYPTGDCVPEVLPLPEG